MSVFLMIALFAFAAVLCAFEIPKMVKGKLYRESWAFSILLGIGVLLAVFKILDIKVFNPSDIVAAAYASIMKFMKGALEP